MSIASFSHVITDAGVGIGGLADENPNVIQGFDEAGWRRGGEVKDYAGDARRVNLCG